MNTPSHAMQESPVGAQGLVPVALSALRPFYWSVRRELWENRSIYIAPLAVAALALVAHLIGIIVIPQHRMSTVLALNPAKQRAGIEVPYQIAEGLIMATAFFVGLFYCLEALHGERRDRSILFWKSLPVSDLTTVLSKAAIPIILLLLSFVLTIATQLIMLLLSTAAAWGSNLSAAPLWTQVSLFPRALMLLYHLLTVHALWYAPIYGYLLLISAWARRAPFLWAVLPPLAIYAVEKIVFNTSHFLAMLEYRFGGPEAYALSSGGGMSMNGMASLDPGKFFSAPGLWIGLVIAAVFLAATVRIRRYRGPI